MNKTRKRITMTLALCAWVAVNSLVVAQQQCNCACKTIPAYGFKQANNVNKCWHFQNQTAYNGGIWVGLGLNGFYDDPTANTTKRAVYYTCSLQCTRNNMATQLQEVTGAPANPVYTGSWTIRTCERLEYGEENGYDCANNN